MKRPGPPGFLGRNHRSRNSPSTTVYRGPRLRHQRTPTSPVGKGLRQMEELTIDHEIGR